MSGNSAGDQFNHYTDEWIQSIKRAVEQAAYDGVKKSLPDIKAGIKTSFRSAMKEFYDDYSPNTYDRSYTLYNVLKIDDGDTDSGFHFWFDPEEIPFRDGSIGLYEQVFEKGWHGGADHISSEKEAMWGVHPAPETPYTRAPLNYWKRWFDKAEIADPPPEENAYIHFNHYAETDGAVTARTYVDDAIRDALAALRR